MTDNQTADEKLSEEFQQLGNNLVETLRAAWDHPERKRLQEEIENGLSDLSDTLKTEASSFKESDTAKRLKSDVENLGERISSSETHEKFRGELLSVLKTANKGLQDVVDEWSKSDETAHEPSPEEPGEE